jgi:hypothetical protein
MSAAIYAQRAMLDFVMIEKEYMPGGQVVQTYEVDNYPGIPKTNGMDLGLKFSEHAKELGAKSITAEVKEIYADEEIKEIMLKNGDILKTRTIILATGAVHQTLGIEGSTDQGIQTFRIECKISDKERNSITVVDDGLYSERLDWDGIGVSDESDGTWEFEGVLGFKNWFFESSKTVSIDEYTLEGKYGSLDYYNFGFIISPEEGNRLELKDGKLYSSDKLIEEVMLKQELDRLNDEYTALKNCKFPSSNSINMTKGEGSDGKLYIKSDIKLSQYLGNELYMTETGIMMAPYTPGPGKPDLTPYVNRLEELEREYPKKDIDLNYLKNSINI